MAVRKKKRRTSGRKKVSRKRTTRKKVSRKRTTRKASSRKKSSKKARRRKNPIVRTVYGKGTFVKDEGSGLWKKVGADGRATGKALGSLPKARKKPSGTPKKKAPAKKKAKKKAGKKKATKKKSYRKYSRSRGARYASYVRSAKKAGKKTSKKSRVTLKAGYPMSTWRKKKYIRQGKLGKQGRVNPGKRRRRRRQKNPSIMACFKQLTRTSFWVSGVQTTAGVSAAIVMPSVLEQVAARIGVGQYVRNSGASGVALSAISTAINMCAAQYVENYAMRSKNTIVRKAARGLAARVALGGMLVTVIKGLEVFARKQHSQLRLPSVPAPIIRVPGISAPAPAAAPGVSGMGDFMQLSGMGDFMQLSGMGGTTSPEALVAGESFSRQVSQFDGMGDYRIPMSAIKSGMGGGYPGQYGMNGWVELNAQPGSPAALAMTGNWEPSSVEAF